MIPLIADPPVVTDVPGTIVRPAAGGAVVFSRHDPVTDRYRLTLRAADGELTTFKIPSRAVPFDIDVGPDARGLDVAVYSRCSTDPALGAPGGGLPYYRTGRRCRLYELSLATGRERRLRTPTERTGSDMLPTIWRGRLAWQHVAAGTITLMLRDGGHTRRLRTGTSSADRLGGTLPAPGVRGLDLRGTHLSLVWSYYDPHAGCGVDAPFGRVPVDELWSYRLGVSRRRVAHAGCSRDAASRIGWAQLTPSGLSYSATFRKNPGEVLVGPHGRAPITIPAGTNFVQSFARLDDGRLAVAYDGSDNGLLVR
jgi:hypothetical protein